MKTKCFDTFTFDELDERAKDKARDWFREGALEYEWWDATYEDAENIGFKIKGFDLGRASYVNGEFLASAEETAHKIEKEHGEMCETFKTAKAYLKKRDELIDTAPKDADGELENEYELDQALDALDAEFNHDLSEDYRVMLEKEMEDRLSDECVDEDIRANEYSFTAEGARRVTL